MELFKIHCSCIGKIMGRIGLTDKQLATMNELNERKSAKVKPLTATMERDLEILIHLHNNPELPATATTYLKEWYAGDKEEIFSKYMDKGNIVESELIDFMADQLGYGLAQKNTETREDEYFIGTCDVEFPKLISDVKAAWNNTTLQAMIAGIDPDYEWQLRGYCRLWDKPEGIVFHGLLNTPPEVNYDREVIYEDRPAETRWIAYSVKRDLIIEQNIIDRVIMCRKWLEQYDLKVKSMIGKLHKCYV